MLQLSTTISHLNMVQNQFYNYYEQFVAQVAEAAYNFHKASEEMNRNLSIHKKQDFQKNTVFYYQAILSANDF